MSNILIYFAGAATMMVIFILWCVISADRAGKTNRMSEYGELCARIQKQIDETRVKISSVKMQMHLADHALDQAILQWKYEYLLKQEQELIDLMCGNGEDSDVQQMPEMRKETDGSGEH